jgi:hypothetical protein
MRKSVYFLLSLLLFDSCSDKNVTSPVDNDLVLAQKLFGKWGDIYFSTTPNRIFNFNENYTFTDSIFSGYNLWQVVAGKFKIEDGLLLMTEFNFIYVDTSYNPTGEDIVTFDADYPFSKMNYVNDTTLLLSRYYTLHSDSNDGLWGRWKYTHWNANTYFVGEHNPSYTGLITEEYLFSPDLIGEYEYQYKGIHFRKYEHDSGFGFDEDFNYSIYPPYINFEPIMSYFIGSIIEYQIDDHVMIWIPEDTESLILYKI